MIPTDPEHLNRNILVLIGAKWDSQRLHRTVRENVRI